MSLQLAHTFQTKTTIFTTIICENMSIQYTVLGFETRPSVANLINILRL